MVTELDKLKRAREYLGKLAEGIDPFTGEELSKDTVLNNVRLSRCFFYVSDVLNEVIANSGRIGKHAGGQKPFSITNEELIRVSISDTPIPVSVFVKAVNDATGDPNRKKLSATKVTDWLLKEGYLKVQETEPGVRRRMLTEKSYQIGMSSEIRQGATGTYDIMLYDSKAQKFLIGNIMNMLKD